MLDDLVCVGAPVLVGDPSLDVDDHIVDDLVGKLPHLQCGYVAGDFPSGRLNSAAIVLPGLANVVLCSISTMSSARYAPLVDSESAVADVQVDLTLMSCFPFAPYSLARPDGVLSWFDSSAPARPSTLSTLAGWLHVDCAAGYVKRASFRSVLGLNVGLGIVVDDQVGCDAVGETPSP